MRRILPFGLVLVVLLHVSVASAITFMEVAGAPNARHPFTARVIPSGPASAYFNPCLMMDFPSSVLAGPFGYFQRLRVTYDARPATADVPAGGAASPAGALTLPTTLLPNARGDVDLNRQFFYVGQGTSTRLLDGRLALGFYLLLASDFFRTENPFFVDEREQRYDNALHFELYGDRMEQVGFAFGLAGRPLPWLGIGAGIALGFYTRSTTELTYASATATEPAAVRTSADLHIRMQPHFSLMVTPLDRLRLTATVHLAYGSDHDTTTRIFVADPAAPAADRLLTLSAGSTYGFQPLRASAGVAWDFGAREQLSSAAPAAAGDGAAGDAATAPPPVPMGHTDGLGGTVGFSVLWAQWSAYRNRQGEAPLDRWSDTVTVAMGGDLRWAGHAWGLDLVFAPTPVPDQVGRTNYVDNTRVGLALGWDWTHDLGGVILRTGLQFQMQRLLPRHVMKSTAATHPVLDEFPAAGDDTAGEAGLQTNNPGYPGFSSEGWLFGVGATIRLFM